MGSQEGGRHEDVRYSLEGGADDVHLEQGREAAPTPLLLVYHGHLARAPDFHLSRTKPERGKIGNAGVTERKSSVCERYTRRRARRRGRDLAHVGQRIGSRPLHRYEECRPDGIVLALPRATRDGDANKG